MAIRRKTRGAARRSAHWLNTYANMITVLLAFFIVLFSASSLDEAKFNMLVTAFAGSRSDSILKIVVDGEAKDEFQEPVDMQDEPEGRMNGTGRNEAFEKTCQVLKQYIEDNNLEKSISVTKDGDAVFIRFMSGLLFEPDSAVLKDEDRDILQFVGYTIKSVENYAGLISVNDHTAAVPENPDYPANDRSLSAARANAVQMFFEEQIGIEPSKIFSQGWGKYKPIATNGTEMGRSQNRRVEILVSGENLLSEQLDNAYGKLVQ